MDYTAYKNLNEVTNTTRGITMHVDGSVIVCDWADVCPNGGLPFISWKGPDSPPQAIGGSFEIRDYGRGMVEDIRAVLSLPEDKAKIYDPNDDISKLLSSDVLITGDRYDVKCNNMDAVVLVPAIWRYGR